MATNQNPEPADPAASTPTHPWAVILAGPNGAGKSTVAHALIHEALTIQHFENADEIAKSLVDVPEKHLTLESGRILILRLRDYASRLESFAFETTLASRTLVPLVKEFKAVGYRIALFFLYLPHPDLAVARVARRVEAGGHAVPEEVIRRRYESGLKNFFGLLQPLADDWRMYENGSVAGPLPIASGSAHEIYTTEQPRLWQEIVSHYGA